MAPIDTSKVQLLLQRFQGALARLNDPSVCPANLTDTTLETASKTCRAAKRDVVNAGTAFVQGLASLVRGTYKADGTAVGNLGEICPYVFKAIPPTTYQSTYQEMYGWYQWCLLNVKGLELKRPTTPPPQMQPKEEAEDKCHDLGTLATDSHDREIKLDPKAKASCITFTAGLKGKTVFIVVDIPPDAYELDATLLPFKKMQPEGGLQRYQYCFLNGWHYAEKSFQIYITKKRDIPNPVVQVGIYPLVEGLCPQ